MAAWRLHAVARGSQGESRASSSVGCSCGCALRPGLGSLAFVEMDGKPTREPGWLPPSAVFGVPRVTGSALGDAPCSMSLSWPELSGNLCAHTSCSESARTYLLL